MSCSELHVSDVPVGRFVAFAGAAVGSALRYADLNDVVGDVAKRLRPRKFPDKVLPCQHGKRPFDIGRGNS